MTVVLKTTYPSWSTTQIVVSCVGDIQFGKPLLAPDHMMDFQELAHEAISDLPKKHNRPSDLKSALRRSAGAEAAHPEEPAKHNLEKTPRDRR